MAACTLTSSALVGSSHTTTRGSPAKARAMATRCFSPPESWRGLRSRWRGDRRRAAASSATRSSACLPLTPVSLTTARFRMRRTVQLRLSAESGFWKTIWMARLVEAGRSALLPAIGSPSSVTSLPASGAWMPNMALASVDLPEPDSPTRPSVSPSSMPRSTPTRAGIDLPDCLKVLDTWFMLSTTRCCDVAWVPVRTPGRGSRPGDRCGGTGCSGHRRRGPAAAARCGTRRWRWRSGRRRRRPAAAAPIWGSVPGMVKRACSSLRMPWRGRQRSRPTV